MVKDLTHQTTVEDASLAGLALGRLPAGVPPRRRRTRSRSRTRSGFTAYHGAATPPADVLRYRGWTGSQIENRYSQWVWRQYASSVLG